MGPKDRVKKLYIGCHANSGGVLGANDSNDPITSASSLQYFNPNLGSGYKFVAPLAYHIPMPVNNISINFGGETR